MLLEDAETEADSRLEQTAAGVADGTTATGLRLYKGSDHLICNKCRLLGVADRTRRNRVCRASRSRSGVGRPRGSLNVSLGRRSRSVYDCRRCVCLERQRFGGRRRVAAA